jgi:hypothetical protein
LSQSHQKNLENCFCRKLIKAPQRQRSEKGAALLNPTRQGKSAQAKPIKKHNRNQVCIPHLQRLDSTA